MFDRLETKLALMKELNKVKGLDISVDEVNRKGLATLSIYLPSVPDVITSREENAIKAILTSKLSKLFDKFTISSPSSVIGKLDFSNTVSQQEVNNIIKTVADVLIKKSKEINKNIADTVKKKKEGTVGCCRDKLPTRRGSRMTRRSQEEPITLSIVKYNDVTQDLEIDKNGVRYIYEGLEPQNAEKVKPMLEQYGPDRVLNWLERNTSTYRRKGGPKGVSVTRVTKKTVEPPKLATGRENKFRALSKEVNRTANHMRRNIRQ